MNGAGAPTERCWRDFRWGAGASRTHRMQNSVAGTGPKIEPAPLSQGTCPDHL